MHVLTARQLCGDMPAPIQISNAQLGGVFNMGGAAVANYVSVLERLR
jgi:acetyl-CoA C-acetyltransferase